MKALDRDTKLKLSYNPGGLLVQALINKYKSYVRHRKKVGRNDGGKS